MAGRASDPSAWPQPYFAETSPARFVEVEADHFVRMHQ
jgi:hypothetical protein